MNPESLIQTFGTLGLFLIIFAESGLLVGFFLPGDSLLFTAGLLASQGTLNLPVIIIGCAAAAIVGDQVGYLIGRRAGPALFKRPDSRLFKRKKGPTLTSRRTARRPSSWLVSCPSSARSCRSWPAWVKWTTGALLPST